MKASGIGRTGVTKLHLRDILKETAGATIVRDCEISGIAYDSRAVEPGHAFFAIQGTVLDGRRFIPDASLRGASAVVTQGDPSVIRVRSDLGLALVPSVRRALSQAANVFYGEPSKKLSVVGVTGTKGKTTVCHFVKSVLDSAGEKTGLIGTVHNIVGEEERPVTRTTPESLDLESLMAEMVEKGSTAVTMEVSSHALALLRVEDITFDVAVLTNIGRDHLDYHSTMENYVASKRHLFALLDKAPRANEGCRRPLAVVNADDPYAEFFLQGTRSQKITFGLAKEATVRAENISMDASGTDFDLILGGKRQPVRISLPGKFNVYNALAAAAVGFGLGYDPGCVAAGLAKARRVRGRVEVVPGGGKVTVWVDYAHTPESLRDILNLAREVSPGKVIALFGCGGDRDRGKRPEMGRIAGDIADFVVITDDNPRTEPEDAILDDIEAGLRGSRCASSFVRIRDRRTAIEEAVGMARPGDVVVLAGKGHETYQEFNGERIHFDDVEVAEEVLRRLEAGPRGGHDK